MLALCISSDLCTWDQLWFQTIWSSFSFSLYIQWTLNWVFSVRWVGQFSRDDWWEQCLKLGSIKWHVHLDCEDPKHIILTIGFYVDPQGFLVEFAYQCTWCLYRNLYLFYNWSGAFMLTKVGVVKCLLIFEFVIFVHTCMSFQFVHVQYWRMLLILFFYIYYRLLVPLQLLKSCYSTCHIECLRLVHGALNVDEKKN